MEKNEFELLPQRKKFECPDCKKKYSHLWKCKDGIKRCTHCKNKLVTNRFYIPKEQRLGFGRITKFTISGWEKDNLHNILVSRGMDSVVAWKRVKNHCYQLRMTGRRQRGIQTRMANREIIKKQEEKAIKRKFVEGLK